MNKLKKCKICNSYTLKKEHCNQPTTDAHYKFIKILKNFDGCQKSMISEV